METDNVWCYSADPRVRLLRSPIQQSTYVAGAHRKLLFSQAVRGRSGAGSVQPGRGRGGDGSGRCAGASSAARTLRCTAVAPPAPTTATPATACCDVTWCQQTRTCWRRVFLLSVTWRLAVPCCVLINRWLTAQKCYVHYLRNSDFDTWWQPEHFPISGQHVKL